MMLLAAVALMATPGDRFAYVFDQTSEGQAPDPAVERRQTPALYACVKNAITPSQSVACFEAERVRQEAALDRAVRAAGKRMPKARVALLAAQQSWRAARDPFCQDAMNAHGEGTILTVFFASCRVEQTIRRTIWLERLR